METKVGPYTIEQRIASGGMAEVFVATRAGPHGFSKRVALKRILPQHANDPDFVAMFIDEARLAARLEHPNIVHVFDFGETENELFLVMELVAGTNVNRLLRAVSQRRETVPLDIALHIVHETSRALAYAHNIASEDGKPLNLVHRDVSPANVLLTQSGHVKLSDFGIARAATIDHRTDEGRLRGKVGYMSPEQVMGKPLDGRSDVFTLSTVFAEMLLAEPLFGRGTDLDILLRVRDADIRTLIKTEKLIPNDVRKLLSLGLSRLPEDRPTSHEFAEAVAKVLHARGKEGGPERLKKMLTRMELVEHSVDGTPDPAFDRNTSIFPLDAFSASISMDTQALSDARTVTSPEIWRVRLPSGEELGPYSFPKLVELITSGIVDARTEVSNSEKGFSASVSFPELTRFVTSPGLQWDKEETKDPTWRGDVDPWTTMTTIYRICADRETGVLHLHDGERRKKIYFVDGRPEFIASTEKRELLGEFLVQSGMCLRMEVEMALALLPRYGGRIGDALVGLGVLRPVELFRAIALQVGDRYLEAFTWTHGKWIYVRGARSHEETFPLGRDPFELIRDAVARVTPGELEAHFASRLETTVRRTANPTVALSSFHASDKWSRILSELEVPTTIARVVENATKNGLAVEEAERALYLGMACNLLETV